MRPPFYIEDPPASDAGWYAIDLEYDRLFHSRLAEDLRRITMLTLALGPLLLAVEREVLEGCPRWREGSTPRELVNALRHRRLTAPHICHVARPVLVQAMRDLAERRRARLTARGERSPRIP